MSDDKRFVSQEEIDNFKKEYSNVEPIVKVLDANMFNVLTMDEIENTKPGTLEYVLHPILPVQGICLIYATQGLGKTLFTLNLAHSVARGGSFLKYNCPKARKVMYIDGEMSYIELHSRLNNIINKFGKLPIKDNLLIITPEKQNGIKIPKIDSKEGQFVYKELIEKYKVEVIVFDNLSMLSSLDENKSNEWVVVQDWFLSLRAMGVTVILVHHAGKDKLGYRGTSRMLDCVNTAISLQPISDEVIEDDDKNINIKKIKVTYQKARGFGGSDSLPFEINLENNIWSYKSMNQTILEKVVERLNSGMSQREIARDLLISQPTVFRMIKKARIMNMTAK